MCCLSSNLVKTTALQLLSCSESARRIFTIEIHNSRVPASWMYISFMNAFSGAICGHNNYVWHTYMYFDYWSSTCGRFIQNLLLHGQCWVFEKLEAQNKCHHPCVWNLSHNICCWVKFICTCCTWTQGFLPCAPSVLSILLRYVHTDRRGSMLWGGNKMLDLVRRVSRCVTVVH